MTFENSIFRGGVPHSNCAMGRQSTGASAVVIGCVVALMALLQTSPLAAQDLRDTLRFALTESPLLREADLNRQAVEQELEQARGLYRPQLDVSADAGPRYRRLENRPGGGNSGLARGASLNLTQLLYDGGGADAEIARQSARVESASFRLLDRTESLALNVTEQYLAVLRSLDVIALGQRQLDTISRIYVSVEQQLRANEASQTDLDQVLERLVRTQNSIVEFELAAAQARNILLQLVGAPLDSPQPVQLAGPALPTTVDEAVSTALARNPAIRVIQADIREADTNIDAANSEFLPTVNLEGRVARDDSSDLEGDDETVAELLVVARWNLYRGGIDTANVAEQTLRARETRARLDSVRRDIEQLVREAWDQRFFELRRSDRLSQQLRFAEDIARSYEAQFLLGEKTLLDVLDAYNTVFNVGVDERGAYYSALFAGFRLLASQQALLEFFSLEGVEATSSQ